MDHNEAHAAVRRAAVDALEPLREEIAAIEAGLLVLDGPLPRRAALVSLLRSVADKYQDGADRIRALAGKGERLAVEASRAALEDLRGELAPQVMHPLSLAASFDGSAAQFVTDRADGLARKADECRSVAAGLDQVLHARAEAQNRLTAIDRDVDRAAAAAPAALAIGDAA